MIPTAQTRVLGRLLVAAGRTTDAEIQAALAEQSRTRERLGTVLIRRGLAPEHVARALAEQLRLPYAEAPLAPTADALGLVGRAVAERLRILPLSADERTIRIAMADPLDVAAIDDIRFRTGRRVEPQVAVPSAIDAALAAYDRSSIDELLTRISPRGADSNDEDVGALRRASESEPIVALVDHVLARAYDQRASDIHVEPGRDRLRVRIRVDGVLRELVMLPRRVELPFISRVKILAGLDIATKRLPQDGRSTARIGAAAIQTRVSTLPSAFGEKVVLRLLDGSNIDTDLSTLGFLDDALSSLQRMLGQSYGLLLVTGPTGAGKTTTLYSALNTMDRERRNIITLEDPIEYSLPGITQVQMHRKAGMTFARALRAVLRQDPDVIMVGELRDRETVETALAAALTGHLVLSTLHTNDAPSTVTRLLEMGARPYLVSAALIGVVAQRLVRRNCPNCAVTRILNTAEREELMAGITSVREGHGCSECSAGYRGRVGIYEVLQIDAETRRLIAARTSTEQLRTAARAAGMRTLAEDAMRKVAGGVTNLREVKSLLLSGDAQFCNCGAMINRAHPHCTSCGRAHRSFCSCGKELEDAWTCCAWCGKTREPAATAGALPRTDSRIGATHGG